jgi:septal ring factor EnvC (AmiA/AmiB activator)
MAEWDGDSHMSDRELRWIRAKGINHELEQENNDLEQKLARKEKEIKTLELKIKELEKTLEKYRNEEDVRSGYLTKNPEFLELV